MTLLKKIHHNLFLINMFFSSGTSDPRAIAQSVASLPGAREISIIVHKASNVLQPDISYMVMQWGQFTDHDITKTASSKGIS